tara:strand:+ start:245 stop:424 length:180 start_codon:yes stop_codon:yes gene_type:complete
VQIIDFMFILTYAIVEQKLLDPVMMKSGTLYENLFYFWTRPDRSKTLAFVGEWQCSVRP